ncbi:uncharacterized protein LOC113782512 [Coffea eugenioides]|uniref:uncharacterized protein LOC113782512 n=1 Tax=Coffea eugenioides TaxID=49369 RepID=UPI000F60EEAA|nr:uncharacterized protein LOC113782512 [Coffea eugenioides]
MTVRIVILIFSDFEDNKAEIVVPDSESEEEDDSMRQLMRSKICIYNPKDEIEFEKGQLFTNVDAFMAVLKDYVIQKCFPLLRLKNERSRVTAICAAKGCQWRIHASPVADNMTFQIKSYQPHHTCVMVKHCAEATSDWMVKKLVGITRDHPNMTSKGVEAELRKYGVKPSKMQIFRAKNKALAEIEGTHAESYSKLPKYAELLRNNNPNSICCRPFVGFDGCFLKEPFGGVLMTAVALDANNNVFPILFAIAECENKDTWRWFFYYFQEFFGPFDNNIPLTFMSDRQKGLNLTYEEIFPDVTGRHCCGHIYSNFKSQFPSILLRSFFWKTAKSYDVVGYNEAIASIKGINREAWKYLDKISRSSWCKCDHVTNNFIESFNNWVGDLRGKPILTLVDGLRRKFMKNLHKRYQKGCTLTANITPRIAKKLTEISQALRKCEMHMASEDTFEIGDLDRSYIVVLSKSYVIVVLFRYLEFHAYSAMIHPIPDVKRWPAMPNLLPKTMLSPPLRRAPGRPRVNRRREADKGASSSQPKRSSTLKCRNCGAAGHNKRTCKGPPVQKWTANRTPAKLKTNRRGKPGRRMAITSLSGAVLWNYVCRGFQSLTNTLILRDHAEGNVPIVHSSQGSNLSPTDHNRGVNVQRFCQTTAAVTNRKRGRPASNNPSTSTVRGAGCHRLFLSATEDVSM